jgi:hypothetical protein
MVGFLSTKGVQRCSVPKWLTHITRQCGVKFLLPTLFFFFLSGLHSVAVMADKGAGVYFIATMLLLMLAKLLH